MRLMEKMITLSSLSAEELGVTNPKITCQSDLRFYSVKQEPFTIYGLYEPLGGSPYHRMPESVAEATNDGVKCTNFNTSGGRVRFVTDSDYIALRMISSGSAHMSNMCLNASSAFDIYVSRNGADRFAGVFDPPLTGYTDGYDDIIGPPWLPKGRKEVTINFPLYSGVTGLWIGLDRNSGIEKRAGYRIGKPILYYGSSITQGGCASRPGMAYEAIISRRLDADFINLGFNGSARAEQPIADYLASLDPVVFVMDYDYNAPDPEYLAKTHENLYRTFRAAHPDTPVIMVGKPDFWLCNESNMERRDVIYRTYNNARLRGEKVIFIDGHSLFPANMREECTVDNCHPNDLGMAGMADVIGKAVEFALSM